MPQRGLIGVIGKGIEVTGKEGISVEIRMPTAWLALQRDVIFKE